MWTLELEILCQNQVSYNARVLYLQSEVTEKWTRNSNKSILQCCLNNLCLKNKFSKIKQFLKFPIQNFDSLHVVFKFFWFQTMFLFLFFKNRIRYEIVTKTTYKYSYKCVWEKIEPKLRIEVQGPLSKYFWVSGTRSNSDKRQKQHSLQQQQNRRLLITTMSKYNASCFIWRP